MIEFDPELSRGQSKRENRVNHVVLIRIKGKKRAIFPGKQFSQAVKF